MRPAVLYIDDHRDYQLRLTKRLNYLSNGIYEIVAIPLIHEAEILHAIKTLTRETLLRITACLCPHHISFESVLDHLPKLAARINFCKRESEDRIIASSFSHKYQTDLDRDIRTDICTCDEIDERITDVHTVSRFARASEIDAILRRLLVTRESPDASNNHRSNCIGTHLSFTHEAGTRITRYVISKEKALGHTVIYLPIKPLYKIESRFRRSYGLTFGDLIYRFTAGDIPDINDMGQWLYMHEDGYYTVSLPERSDDLITCDIDTLRQITHAWCDYTRTRSQPTTSWIDIEGMPLCSVLELAVLCDFIYVDAPVGSLDKETVARRELGLFMAKLPKECRILELPNGFRTLEEIDHIDHHKEADFASEL